uniref:Uncharacterized protein n=1 Tax=Tanacetum cinerariifolium TaxID=118510 RepID=A0A699GKM8_TANCI|nr:hypothetical protein [Tanacetum cinerariifolium]
MVEEILRNHMYNTVPNVHPSSSSSIYDLQPEASRKRDHDDHPEGEKGLKRQRTTKGASSANKEYLCHSKTRSDPDIVFSNLIDEVCVKRADEKAYFFSESDFKYWNKTDIEDMYYICMRRRNNPQEIALIKSLIVFIRSCVIWERVHDFQLGIESYQIKFDLTAPTITFLGIETLPLYSIIADPFVDIVYENNKKEKRAMNIDELQKLMLP